MTFIILDKVAKCPEMTDDCERVHVEHVIIAEHWLSDSDYLDMIS